VVYVQFVELRVAGSECGYNHPHPPRQAVLPVASIQTTLTLLLFIPQTPYIAPPPIHPFFNTTTGLRDMEQDIW